MCGPKFCSMHHTRSIDEQIEKMAEEQGLIPSTREPRETEYARELLSSVDRVELKVLAGAGD